ncbi:MAG: hypothetical protein ACE5HZ_04585 [Fidelibacterota bacterium]
MRLAAWILIMVPLSLTNGLLASSGILTYRPEYHGPVILGSSWQPAPADTDTAVTEPQLGKYPARGLVLSLAVPGLGQWYAGAKWKSLLFVGIEVAAWTVKLQFDNRSIDKRIAYQAFADTHWDLEQWLLLTPTLTERYPDVICDGTHDLTILLEDETVVSSDSLCGGFIEGAGVVPNREYYENIGKYDQFVAGWDDLYDDQGNPNWEEVKKSVGDSVEILVMTPNRDRYVGMRDDYNRTLRLAGYALSTIMLNHLVSAVDAFLETRRRGGVIPGAETSLRLEFSPYRRYGIGGVSLSIAW